MLIFVSVRTGNAESEGYKVSVLESRISSIQSDEHYSWRPVDWFDDRKKFVDEY